MNAFNYYKYYYYPKYIPKTNWSLLAVQDLRQNMTLKVISQNLFDLILQSQLNFQIFITEIST